MRYSLRALFVFVTLICLVLTLAFTRSNERTLRNTGREMDIAVAGKGLLYLTDVSTGEMGFCRSASLELDPDLQLVARRNRTMWAIEPRISLPADWTAIDFLPDGSVRVRTADRSWIDIGILQFARFDHPQHLKSRGDGILVATEDSGFPTISSLAEDSGVAVCQGWVEVPSKNLCRWIVSSPIRVLITIAIGTFTALVSWNSRGKSGGQGSCDFQGP